MARQPQPLRVRLMVPPKVPPTFSPLLRWVALILTLPLTLALLPLTLTPPTLTV